MSEYTSWKIAFTNMPKSCKRFVIMQVMTSTNGEKILIQALVLIGIDYAGIFFNVTFFTLIETVFSCGVIKLSRE